MRYLVAVSGGIDSVVLLHLLVQDKKHDLIVAHFDHGIREDSAADARFVKGLAEKYHLPFVSVREELGAGASEDLARTHRYRFLREEAKKHESIIVTAHHQDDVIETIAINITRGTGWRGLAVLGASDVLRPLRQMSKQKIREYARVNHLEWVEDVTNTSEKYLRNRLRHLVNTRLSDEQKQALITLWHHQMVLKKQIDTEAKPFLQENGTYARYFFIMASQTVAIELLRLAVSKINNKPTTLPQAERALLAIKTARAGSSYQIGSGVTLRFTSNSFVVG